MKTIKFCIITSLVFTLFITNKATWADSGISSTASPESGSSGQRSLTTAFSQLFNSNRCSFSSSLEPGELSSGICSFFNGLDAAETSSSNNISFDGLAAQSLSSQADIQVNTTALSSPAQQTKKISDRLAQRRGEIQSQQDCLDKNDKINLNKTGRSSEQECLDELSKPNYSPDEKSVTYGALGLFMSGKGSWGETERNDGETGFEKETYDGTLGFDYRFSNQLISGLAFNYSYSETDLELDNGYIDSNNYRLSVFTTWVPIQNTYIDLVLGHGWVDFDLSRKCPTCNTGLNAQSDYDGNQYFASLGTGYTYRQGAWRLKGYVKGDYIYLKTGGYSLNYIIDNSTTLTNNVQGQNVKSLTSTLGAEVGRAFSTSFGVVIPKVRAEWVHEYKNGARSVSSTFISGNTKSEAVLSTAGPERNWFNIGTTIQFVLPNSVTGFFGYEALLMQDTSNHTISGGFRLQF